MILCQEDTERSMMCAQGACATVQQKKKYIYVILRTRIHEAHLLQLLTWNAAYSTKRVTTATTRRVFAQPKHLLQ